MPDLPDEMNENDINFLGDCEELIVISNWASSGDSHKLTCNNSIRVPNALKFNVNRDKGIYEVLFYTEQGEIFFYKLENTGDLSLCLLKS